MKQHLRVVAEVAVLGTLAMSVAVFGQFALVPVMMLFSTCGISLNLVPLSILLGTLFPFAVGFYYGLRRKLQLSLVAVWIGWIVGGYGSGALISVTLLRHAKMPPQKPLTPSLWANWLIWLGLVILPTLLMALLTMWGQRRRLRRTL